MELTYEDKAYLTQKKAKSLGLYDFSREYLGYKDLNHIHKDLCQFLEKKALFKLVLMPRYSFKSTICTIGKSIKDLVNDPNKRILIYSDASAKANGFLSSIKSHIDGSVSGSLFNSAFQWTPTDPKAKWNESQIVIRARNSAYPEPSVDTGGIETSKVGMHYDTIIFDDIVSDKNITTKEQMDKVAECYKRALSLLKPGGEVLIVGTRWHFGDLYGRIIAENKTTKVFSIIIVDGEDDPKYGEYCFKDIGLSKEFLDSQKRNQGSYTYSCLYRNSPVDADTAVFKTKDFAFYGAVKKEDLYITATVDPAGKGEDFTAITVVGTDHKMDMYILEITNKHLQPSEIVDEILRLNFIYKFKKLGIEENFFRGMLRMELERRIAEEREKDNFNLFGVEEFTASSRRGESKETRIRGLQPYHERHALKFPGSEFELLEGAFSELAYQMIQFPSAPHDDILDSLAYHLPLIRKGGVVKKADLPHNSPAELERRWLDQQVKRNNRLPRKLRRQVETTLAFS